MLALQVSDVNKKLHETFALLGPILNGQAWPLKMGPISCPETSVDNYQHTLRTIPEERKPQLHSGGGLKTRKNLHGLTNFCKTCHCQISWHSAKWFSSYFTLIDRRRDFKLPTEGLRMRLQKKSDIINKRSSIAIMVKYYDGKTHMANRSFWRGRGLRWWDGERKLHLTV